MELFFDTASQEFRISLKNNLSYTISLGEDVHGNIIRINNAIDGLDKQLVKTTELLEDTKQEINKEFPQESELKEKSKRLDGVIR